MGKDAVVEYPVFPAERGREAGGGPQQPRVGVSEGGRGQVPSATSRPPASSAAASLSRLRQDLGRLQTREALQDRRSVPDLALQIARTHLPTAGPPAVFSAMAGAFAAPGLDPRFRLVVAYVFHDLLVKQVSPEERSSVARDGATHFLESVKDVVAALPAEKKESFLKLLGTWQRAHLFSEGYLRRLRHEWTCGPAHRPPRPQAPVHSGSSSSSRRQPVASKAAPTSPPLPPPTTLSALSGRRAALRRPRPDALGEPQPTSPACPPTRRQRRGEVGDPQPTSPVGPPPRRRPRPDELRDPQPTSPPCAPARKLLRGRPGGSDSAAPDRGEDLQVCSPSLSPTL